MPVLVTTLPYTIAHLQRPYRWLFRSRILRKIQDERGVYSAPRPMERRREGCWSKRRLSLQLLRDIRTRTKRCNPQWAVRGETQPYRNANSHDSACRPIVPANTYQEYHRLHPLGMTAFHPPRLIRKIGTPLGIHHAILRTVQQLRLFHRIRVSMHKG
jgi:hypothetical protein